MERSGGTPGGDAAAEMARTRKDGGDGETYVLDGPDGPVGLDDLLAFGHVVGRDGEGCLELVLGEADMFKRKKWTSNAVRSGEAKSLF